MKTLIKQHQKPNLNGFAVNKLKLYQLKGVTFDEFSKHLEKIREISENLGSQDSPKLNLWKKLSMIEFPEDMLHILVVPPAGESINSRACTCKHGQAEKGQWSGQPPTTFEHTIH